MQGKVDVPEMSELSLERALSNLRGELSLTADDDDGPSTAATVAFSGQHATKRYGILLSEVGLLIPAGEFSELITQQPITPIPTKVDCFIGLINLRGNLVPTFELEILFKSRSQRQLGNGAGSTTDKQSRHLVLVLGKGGDAVGFRLSDVPITLTLAAQQKVRGIPELPQSIADFCAGAYTTEKNIWLEFDFRQFVERSSYDGAIHNGNTSAHDVTLH